jgi:hypothetical protein
MAKRINKPFDDEKFERLQNAVDSAHDIVVCIQELALKYYDHASDENGACFIATLHLSHVAGEYLENLQAELSPKRGFAISGKKPKKPAASWRANKRIDVEG